MNIHLARDEVSSLPIENNLNHRYNEVNLKIANQRNFVESHYNQFI